jgi:hypothetical protein
MRRELEDLLDRVHELDPACSRYEYVGLMMELDPIEHRMRQYRLWQTANSINSLYWAVVVAFVNKALQAP